MTRRYVGSAQLGELDEKAWDAMLFGSKDGLATTLGWRDTYHTLRSKGSVSGYPDRTLARDRIIFAELKTDKKDSTATDRQRAWLDKLARAGGEVYLWRPRDLEEIAEILAKRWQFTRSPEVAAEQALPALLRATIASPWTPGSLWIPGHGRYDTMPIP